MSSIRPPRRPTWRPSSEALLLTVALFWALLGNRAFLQQALQGWAPWQAATVGWGAALVALLVGVHALLLAPLAVGPLTKPVLAVALVVAAAAGYFVQSLGVYVDPSMLRNVLRTDAAEAGELLSPALALHLLLYAGLPLVLLAAVPLRRRTGARALLARTVFALAMLVLVVAVGWAAFQPLSSLMRTHKELRYRITPANALWSSGVAAAALRHTAAAPRRAIGLDARPGPRMAARTRPLVVVLVVGETVRAANWGLTGYARQTTPELAALPDLVSFADVTACGTNTEVSLPCLFAPVGRRDYDEDRIRGSQSLLHVVARAGVDVRWRDNQSGCKGVCDGLPNETVAAIAPALCADGRCLDEGLLEGLPAWLGAAAGTRLLVLHPLGNHGPSYFRRYPAAFERFVPACLQDDLRLCSRQEIVNAYDNALLYTDHELARLVGMLRAASGRVDSVLLFVADHGESLGESNLFLHGVPYAIAPDVQTRVPMLLWLSPGAPVALGLDPACLRARAAKPAAHDHVFHTLLGLLDVRTTLHEPAWDLADGCRR